ncbi:hypothetical protein LZ554_006165 [Drepanopeziza brunnea f. sp. 'monogermtubi']|nr:hypothetical protein LZ554_006165 [Drepanopeziza brunnea f. sp. 'monogermtubi']
MAATIESWSKTPALQASLQENSLRYAHQRLAPRSLASIRKAQTPSRACRRQSPEYRVQSSQLESTAIRILSKHRKGYPALAVKPSGCSRRLGFEATRDVYVGTVSYCLRAWLKNRGGKFVDLVERNLKSLHDDLIELLALHQVTSTENHCEIWPHRLVSGTTSDSYHGFYMIGIHPGTEMREP